MSLMGVEKRSLVGVVIALEVVLKNVGTHSKKKNSISKFYFFIHFFALFLQKYFLCSLFSYKNNLFF